MDIRETDLSKAVIVYLGFGSASSPQSDRIALVRTFGDQRAVELESEVRTLLDEVSHIAVDWSTHSLVSAGEMAKMIIHERHPELTERALQALEWKFTFDWR